MAYKVNTLGDLKGLPEDIVNQIRAQVTEDPSSVTSDPPPVRKSATEVLRDQQRAILARDQRPADPSTNAPTADPPTAHRAPLSTSHPVFCALMLSKLVYGAPRAEYSGKVSRLVITLEGGLRLHVDLQLWTVRYQAGSQFGPLRPVTPLTLDERIALRNLISGQSQIT